MAALNGDILTHVGGNSVNNLNDILGNFDDHDEIHTFDDSLFYIESLDSVLSSDVRKFNIMTLNIQNLNAKFDNLVALLSHCYNQNIHFSAICIQETWLSDNHDTTLFHIPGYHLIHQGYRCGTHSGLIIYLQEEYTFNLRNIYMHSKIW